MRCCLFKWITGNLAVLQIVKQCCQRRPGFCPFIQRRLQGGGNRVGLGTARQIARDNDQPAVTRAVIQSRQFHQCVLSQ